MQSAWNRSFGGPSLVEAFGYVLFGAAAFWAPTSAGWFLPPIEVVSFLMLNLAGPVACVAGLWLLRRWLPSGRSLLTVATFMVIGIWLAGPTVMSTTWGAVEGWSAASHLPIKWLFFFTLLPPYTFIMATYGGCLFGLLAATVALPISTAPTLWTQVPCSPRTTSGDR